MILEPTDEQAHVLSAINSHDQNILVEARPGRGKTTTALLIAEHIIEKKKIDTYQQVLFLTFSRNSVYQIKQAGRKNLDNQIQKRLSISTYHSFMWWLISGFGRFHGIPSKLDVTGKAKARVIRAEANELGIDEDQRCFFSAKKFNSISYDEFASITLALLSKSENLCKAISHRFPIIIVDEFQDTNIEQWELIKIISQNSRLICFADPDQMIYGWRGACDDRLQQLIDERSAKRYPLQQKSMRTSEYDILNFAESFLDNNLDNLELCKKYNRKFLRDYHGQNALGYHLKEAILQFTKDFRKRGMQDKYPTIAIAAYSNATARAIQESLGKPTAKAPKTYKCCILQSEMDDSLKELIIHLSIWLIGRDSLELARAMQLIGGILAPKNSETANALASLFFPKKLIDKSVKARGTTKIIMDEFTTNDPLNITSSNSAILEAVNIINRLRIGVKSIGNKIQESELSTCQSELIRLLSDQKGNSSLCDLNNLQERLSSERLQREVLEVVAPMRGIISSTLHKLKGREFDYICIVTIHNDKLCGDGSPEKDARRLMYVALTRARYDARVLYIGSHPCFLLAPYL